MPSDGLRYAAGASLLAVAYAVAAEVGLSFAVVHGSTSAVWAPTGLAIGALAVMGLRYWPGVFAGALGVNLAATGHLPSSLAIAAGNSAEGVIGAWAVTTFCAGGDAFDRPNTTARFVFWAGVVAPLTSSIVGPASLVASGLLDAADVAPVWVTWYVGNAMGALIVAPAILLLPRLVSERAPGRGEAAGLATALLLISLPFVFGLMPEVLRGSSVGTLALPVVAWAAIRFGPLTTAWTTLSFAAMGLFAFANGIVVSGVADPNTALMELQSRLAVLSLAGLLLAAIVRERRDAYEALAHARDELEGLVGERTERLRGAMADLHEAQELAGLGRWQYNAANRLFSGSPWLHRTLDVATAAPLADWTRAMGRQEGKAWMLRMKQAMRSGRPFSFIQPIHVGGRVRHLEFTGAPLEGRGWHGTCQDVSQAQEAAATARRLATLVEHSPMAIIAAGSDGVIDAWNRAAESLLGYSREEAAGMDLRRLVPDDEWPAARAHRQRVLERGEVVETECHRIHKDGTRIPIHITLAPVEDPSGGGRRVTALLRDLRPEREARRMTDEARRVEQELRVLDEVARLKSEFINMASHELRTPLTPIRVQLHLLKMGRLDAAGQERAVAVIERNMVRLSTLVEDVFAAARVQHGGFRMRASATDLGALTQDVLTMFEGQAEQQSVALESRVRGDVSLRADPERMTQVLVNLVSNALKYAPPESTVHVELLGGAEHVRLAVEDEGPGIPEERRKDLFQPFSRLDEQPHGGTGLGLYICKGIAELHGGRIRVAPSRHKNGARFEMVLPRHPHPDGPEGSLERLQAEA